MSISVAIVEDDARFAEGIKCLLDRSEGYTCAGVCHSGEAALRDLPGINPQVVLMDIHLPGLSGVECVRSLKERLPDTEIAMLTVFEDYDQISRSLFAGASSYLLKSMRPEELLVAIRQAHEGGSPMPSAIARKVVNAFRQFAPASPEAEPLSEREQEVLGALAKGRRYKEVADELGITYDTVRTHVQRIYKKLHVQSRAQAVKQFQVPAGERGH
jgi:DNA-binding NarL/FixJ family response regulator